MSTRTHERQHSMTRTRIPAAIAAAATAAGLALTAAPAASAATSPAPAVVQQAPSVGSLSIRAVRSVVRPGHPATINGTLAAPNTSVAGKSVTLESMARGASDWSVVATGVTRDSGGVTATAPVTGPTRFRWVFAGDSSITPATSGVVQVHTSRRAVDSKRLSSSVSIRLRNPQHAGGRTTVVGSLRGHGAPLPHEQVLLLVRRAGASWWSVAQAHRTSWNGHVRFVVNGSAGASYRLSFLGDQRFLPSESGVVRDANHSSLTIWGSPSQIDPNTPATVGGTLSVDGAPAAGRAVNLLGHDVNTRYGWKVVARGTTAANGSVTFVVTPRESMRYRLVAPAGSGATAARSTTTVVSVRTPTVLRITGKAVASGYAVTGRLASRGYAVRNQAVILQEQQADGTWASIDSHLSDAKGRVRFVEPTKSGTTYQLLFVGAGRWATSTSPTLTQP